MLAHFNYLCLLFFLHSFAKFCYIWCVPLGIGTEITFSCYQDTICHWVIQAKAQFLQVCIPWLIIAHWEATVLASLTS